MATKTACVLLALEWVRLDCALKDLKKSEAEKRAELVAACFPAGVSQGTNTAQLANGYIVKATVSPAAKFPDIELLNKGLGKLRAVGEAGILLAGRLIKWKPSLSIAEYKKLSPAYCRLFAGAIVVGDSTPSVEVVAPA